MKVIVSNGDFLFYAKCSKIYHQGLWARRLIFASDEGFKQLTEVIMDKNKRAPFPPMGWNSWDCYGAAVNEEQLMGNAEYMAKNLKQYGYEYVVCDIQWYEPTAESMAYHKFAELEMDEYSRLIPAANRFPSAADGTGFKSIADRIHGMGLKFGIHIMRGIPRQAVHRNTPIKGGKYTARDIAQEYSVCSWNTDMYGVNPDHPGAQIYYDSIFELYASWGVDFVKCDDICVTEGRPDNFYSGKGEIECIKKAIDHSGRDIVLSLSPGPAILERAEHLSENANMWRMTGDFWDNWNALDAMFKKCKDWAPYVKEGCWPDCDMLPLGRISIHNGERRTNFTKDEQITLMSLWCIFRSPLMMGGEMRDNDDFTLSILTNPEVLALEKETFGAREVMNAGGVTVWKTGDDKGNIYLGIFNRDCFKKNVSLSLPMIGITNAKEYRTRDLWKREEGETVKGEISREVNAHGAVLIRLS